MDVSEWRGESVTNKETRGQMEKGREAATRCTRQKEGELMKQVNCATLQAQRCNLLGPQTHTFPALLAASPILLSALHSSSLIRIQESTHGIRPTDSAATLPHPAENCLTLRTPNADISFVKLPVLRKEVEADFSIASRERERKREIVDFSRIHDKFE